MTQEAALTKNMFLAVIFDEHARHDLAHTFRLPLDSSVVRWEEKVNLHLTIGYIAQVQWHDRLKVIEAFHPLKNIQIFTAEVRKGLSLGINGDSLCLEMGPFEKFSHIHKFAGELLFTSTPYQFDPTYTYYIPHIKIQGIRHYIDQDEKNAIAEQFMSLSRQKFRLTIKTIALMERAHGKSKYNLIQAYQLLT
jgi:2'-5' RNA ligase